ncbi:MAG: hypothetical protein LC776_09280, partial [Acidobacteria bacterium]|nr:hypothetical protein [Acidobacteriota bacterium]
RRVPPSRRGRPSTESGFQLSTEETIGGGSTNVSRTVNAIGTSTPAPAEDDDDKYTTGERHSRFQIFDVIDGPRRPCIA